MRERRDRRIVSTWHCISKKIIRLMIRDSIIFQLTKQLSSYRISVLKSIERVSDNEETLETDISRRSSQSKTVTWSRLISERKQLQPTPKGRKVWFETLERAVQIRSVSSDHSNDCIVIIIITCFTRSIFVVRCVVYCSVKSGVRIS